MIKHYFPTFLKDRSRLVKIERDVRGDQITQPSRAILVCEALLDQKEREGHAFEKNKLSRIVWHVECINALITTIEFIFKRACHLAILLDGEDELLFEFGFAKAHVFRRGKPDVRQDIGKEQVIFDCLSHQLPRILIFRHGAASFCLSCLGIDIVLGFRNNFIPNGDRGSLAIIERTDKVDPLTLRFLQ